MMETIFLKSGSGPNSGRFKIRCRGVDQHVVAKPAVNAKVRFSLSSSVGKLSDVRTPDSGQIVGRGSSATEEMMVLITFWHWRQPPSTACEV
ncbi:hypothetical protein [Nocardia sp. NPDC004711]